MTAELIRSIEKLGLNEKEAKVYIAGLEMGQFSVLELSQKTGIKRPTCYLILDDLIKKGLMTTLPKAKKVLYVAEHPNKLIVKAADSYELAKQLVPELQDLIDTTAEKPQLKVYAGQKGIQGIYEDMTDEEKDIYYIASVRDLVDAVGQEFLDDWIKQRIEKGIKTFSIRMKETEIDKKLYAGSLETLRTVRYAPKGFETPYTIFIYGKKVGFVSTKKDLFGFIVESSDLAKSMKALFDVVWSVSSK